jgi:hypothetical protein
VSLAPLREDSLRPNSLKARLRPGRRVVGVLTTIKA